MTKEKERLDQQFNNEVLALNSIIDNMREDYEQDEDIGSTEKWTEETQEDQKIRI